MGQNKTTQIKRNIQLQVATEGKRRCLSNHVCWIIQQYLYYAWKALVNGWPIKVRANWDTTSVAITLKREPARKLGKREEGIFFISNKLFGDMFSLKMSGNQIDSEYLWYPASELAKQLQASLDSDNIYELMKS